MGPEGMLQWIESLDDLTDDEFCTALKRFSRESKEFPSPAAVRGFAGTVGLSDNDRATIAWSKVRESIRKVGGYSTVTFDDPIINAAIRDMGGWVMLCETDSVDMKWREQDFRRIYGAIAKAGIGDASPLAGICERTNAKLGYAPQEPAVAVETGLPVHPAAPALPVVEREPKRLTSHYGDVVNGALVKHVEAVLDERPEPPPKDEPRDPATERAKLLAAFPAAAVETGKAAS
jgi:hypothetical protein